MKRLALITLILGAAFIVVPVASAIIPADDGSVSGGSAALPGGVQLTGKNLAAFYDTGAVVTSRPTVSLSGKNLSDFYDTGAMVTSQPFVPLSGKNLSGYYDTGAVVTSTPAVNDSAKGITLHTDVLGGNGGSSSTPVSGGDSSDWNTPLAVTLAGMLLLAIAATTITRRKHRLSF